jgi:hypothetical protein
MRQELLAAGALFLMAVAAPIAQTSNQTFKGHLVDTVCADGHVKEDGYAVKHENSCNLMPGCMKTGYSLMTADKRAIKLDPKGIEQATALVKSTKKTNDLKVTVVGKMEGQTLAVSTITVD